MTAKPPRRRVERLKGTTSSPPKVDLGLEDSFRAMFGAPSVTILRSVWQELAESNPAGPNQVTHEAIRDQFMTGLTYSLPQVAEGVKAPERVHVSPFLSRRAVGNIFFRNPHACGLAAAIVYLHQGSDGSAMHPIPPDMGSGATAISMYLALVTESYGHVDGAYNSLLNKLQAGDEAADYAQAFTVLRTQLTDRLEQSVASNVRRGIKAVIDAMMLVRDERVEENPVTIDLQLPLNCSWELFADAVGEGEVGAAKTGLDELKPTQESLKRVAKVPRDLLARELTDLGKHVGRGIGVCKLRDDNPPGPEREFVCSSLWGSHERAPQSLLYDLDWLPPTTSYPADLRLVLLPNSTVSIVSRGDPLFDYRPGGWRYVDLLSKTRVLATVLEGSGMDALHSHGPIYRLSRLGYHLAYHNEGATLDLNLSPVAVKGPERHLASMVKRWKVPDVDPIGMTMWVGSPGSGAHLSKKRGRLAYSLTTHDGMTIWEWSKSTDSVILREFGHFEKLNPKVAVRWAKFTKAGGFPDEPIGGARHRSAYSRALAGTKDRLVLCISQDGGIDAYMGEQWMPLR